MKLNFSKLFLIIFLLFLFVFINSYSYANSISNNLSSQIFRLHIIANSDSKDDQNLKLKVRDNILKYLESKLKNSKSKQDTRKIVEENILELQKIAVKTIKENGYDYNVKLEIGNFYFPTKYYGNISMPSGNYDALRIKIGKACGRNWWCSLFPSLCFSDVSNGIVNKVSKENLKKNLKNEEFDILTDKSAKIQFKFKIVELFH